METNLQASMNDIELGAEAFLKSIRYRLSGGEAFRMHEFCDFYDLLCSREVTMELLALLITGQRTEAQDRAREYLEAAVAGEPLHSRDFKAKAMEFAATRAKINEVK